MSSEDFALLIRFIGLIIYVVFMVIGVNARRKDKRKKIDTFNEYKVLIQEKNIASIDEIARVADKTPETVMLQIQQMIDEKFITNVHIDLQSKRLIPGAGKRINSDDIRRLYGKDNIICNSCGASNPIINDKCEYCGTPLRLK